MSDPSTDRNEPQFERRIVEVREPELSDSTNAKLTDELRGVIGADEVEVPAGRPHPSSGETVARRRGLPIPLPLPNSFVVAQVGLALVVVGAIAALAMVVHRWWTLVLAVLVLGAVTYLVVAMVIRMTSNPERPSATTVAAMDEEGVADPEQLFSDVVGEFTAAPGTDGEPGRTTDAIDDHARAAAEQRDASTPSGGPSTPIGPE